MKRNNRKSEYGHNLSKNISDSNNTEYMVDRLRLCSSNELWTKVSIFECRELID